MPRHHGDGPHLRIVNRAELLMLDFPNFPAASLQFLPPAHAAPPNIAGLGAVHATLKLSRMS